MPGEPNKPEGEEKRDGTARPVENRQAVRNQGEAKPDDYPEPAGGDAGETGA